MLLQWQQWQQWQQFLLLSSVVLLLDELLAALSEDLHSLVQGLQQTLQLLLLSQQTVHTVHRVLQDGSRKLKKTVQCRKPKYYKTLEQE